MSKTHKHSSHAQETTHPSAVAFANLLSDVFEACFSTYQEQKKEAWVKEQKQAGHTLFVMDDGSLVAAEIKSTFKKF